MRPKKHTTLRRPSLAVSIIWRFVFFATLPVIIGGAVTLFFFTQKNVDDIRSRNLLRAYAVAQDVRQELQKPVIVLSTLSMVLGDTTRFSLSAADSILQEVINEQSSVASLHLTDRTGKPFVRRCSSHDGSDDDCGRTVDFVRRDVVASAQADGEPLWTPAFTIDGNSGLWVNCAIRNRQTIVAGRCRLTPLCQRLDSISVKNGFMTALVDRTGISFCNSGMEADSGLEKAAVRFVHAHLPSCDTSRTFSFENSTYIGTTVQLDNPEWRIIVVQSIRSAYTPVLQLTLLLIGILTALALFSALGGWFSARWLSRLFSFLSNNARRIADGDYHAKMPDQDHRELEALAENIRSMVNAVRQREEQYRDLNQETRRNLQFQRTLLEAINIPVVYYNAQGDILGCNTMFETAMGVGRDRILHLNDYREAPKPLRQLMEMIKTSGDAPPRAFERTLLFADRRQHTVIIHRAPFYLDEESLDGYICALLDITEHRMTEDAFQRLIQSTVGVHGVDFFHRIVRLLCDWIGCDGALIGELTGTRECRGVSMVLNGLRVDEYTFGIENSPAQKAIDEGFFSIEDDVCTIFPLDQELKRLAVRGYAGVALEADDGTRLGVLELLSRSPLRLPTMARGSMEILASLAASEMLRMRAEREQVKLESQLRQMEKMEAIGQLAGGIAHDINNQLGCILGYSDIIQDVNKEPFISEFVKKISQSVSRSADLVKKLLAFSRHGNCIMKPVNVTALMHEVVGLLQHSIDKTIALSMVAADGQQYVMGDPSQLQNALLNLGLNARDAMPVGGTITYEVHGLTVGTEEQKQFPTCPDGRFVCVKVRDNGVGIQPEIIERIFEPFFTTKPEGKGTGLGLAAVYGTISSHRGFIDVKSRVGEGTLFTVLLPYYDPPAEILDEKVDEVLTFGSGTILVIDDEIDIRDSVAMMLRKCGFTVITAGDGLEGVQLYIKFFGKIDLVILDMIMPGIDGKSTFERLIEVDADVKVIVVSGYSVDGRVQSVLDNGAKSFLQKPFRAADLLRMAANVLAQD